MRRGRRRIVPEINLTPLLDVLFSILFIVMMTAMQNEQGLKDDFQEKLSNMEREKAQLSEELSKTENELDRAENEMSSYDKYHSEAVILTVDNVIRGDDHVLRVYRGTEKEELENIQMGSDRTENTKARIDSIITEIVDSTDNQPIYIVFYCSKGEIYTAEYRAVTEAFNTLQENNKAVFFKVMQEQ